jgi:opacity protein-like surface antigen
MSAKRLAILVVSVAVLISSAFAQIYERSVEQNNELSVTAGRTFVSTQTIQNSTAFNPHIHFGNEESVDFNYSRLLKSKDLFALYGELPVAIYPRMDLNTERNVIPKDIGALFITPSARLNFFPGQGISPWLSAGGGYGRFREAPRLNFFGANPGPTGTNTGVIQFGAGLDVWPWRRWGARVEVRDFYSGVPALNVSTGRSRQHNYYVGVGVIRRF